MTTNNCIQHSGIVKEITPQSIFVSIISASACSGCHSKGLCNLSEIQEKVVEVQNNINYTVKKGDVVNLEMKSTLGTKAVVLGYVMPFILMVGCLILFTTMNMGEGMSALLSLSVLVPYYFILYSYRNKLKKQFMFTLK